MYEGKKVLIVDDSKVERLILKEILKGTPLFCVQGQNYHSNSYE